jgi:hypothetical protein
MATLTTQFVNEDGLQITLSSASESGDDWENNGQQFIFVKNGSGESLTITITTQITSFESPTYGDSTKSNATLVVANGQHGMIGPFPVSAYNDTNGKANITYSSVSSVQVGIFEINN